MNQGANARAASLERCKRMAQSPSPPPSLSLSLPWSPSFSSVTPFPSRAATYLWYSLSPLCSHSTSVWHIYSFLSLFYSIILPLSCFLICSFHSLFISFSVLLLYCISLVPSFLLSASLLTVLSPEPPQTLYPLLLFSKRGKEKMYRELKRNEDRGKKDRASIRERGRRPKEERLKAHYFPLDGRKWVRGQ